MLRATWNSFRGRPVHLSDGELLSFLDGELPSRLARRVQDHLESCWHCRTRRQKMELAIAWFVDADAQVIGSLPPPRSWRDFPEKLDRLIAERRGARTEAFLRIGWPLRRMALGLCGVLACAAMVTLWNVRNAAQLPPQAVVGQAGKTPPPAPALLPNLLAERTAPPPVRPLAQVPPLERPSAAALTAKQIEIEYALHQLRACMGGEMRVERQPDRTLVVSGVAATAERESQIQAALAKVRLPAWTSVRIRMERGSPHSAAPPVAVANESEIKAEKLPVEDRLQAYVAEHPETAAKDRDAAAELSERILGGVSSAVSEAWALRRLAEEYSDSQMDPAHRHMLAIMVADHLTALSRYERAAAALAVPILGINPAQTANPHEPSTWAAASLLAFEQTTEFERDVSVLFGGDPSGVAPGEAERQLTAVIPRLEAAIRTANREANEAGAAF